MASCCVYGCANNSSRTRGVKYLQFPKNEELCRQWFLACKGRRRISLKTARVCSDHFKPMSLVDKNEPAKYGRRLKKFRLKLDLCPTEKLPSDKPDEITNDEANEITEWCQMDNLDEYDDAKLEKMVSKLEDTIHYLEKENRYLLHNLEALEQLNTRTLIEINALKNKLGC